MDEWGKGEGRKFGERHGKGRAPEREWRLEQRRGETVRHTAEMYDRFATEIERAGKAARFFDAVPAAPAAAAGVVPEVSVVDQSCVSAILEQGRGLASACDLAVLDFASFTYPGGGYARGTMAQEESLCAESFLYNVLKRFDGWYAENRRRNINCELYRDRALVVPAVRFERERYHSYADVIVAAAPNARRAVADYHVSAEALERSLRSRVRLVMAIADTLGHGKLILGAFGCGVFGCDAHLVAEVFRSELAEGSHVASQVTFAIPRGRADENLEIFEHAFVSFPERNEAPYVTREELAARSVAEAPEPADEDEDDWRKYL